MALYLFNYCMELTFDLHELLELIEVRDADTQRVAFRLYDVVHQRLQHL